MMFRSIFFVGCVLLLTNPNSTLAAKGDPCADGQLKGWAKKNHEVDYCAPIETNTSPTIAITSPNDQQSFSTEDAITFTASASDAEDGDLSSSVVWNSSIDGSITASTLLSSGSHIITASVTDSGSLVATDSLHIDVSEPINTPPTVSIDSPLPGSTVEEGTILSLQASANDLEDGNLSSSITWSSSLDGALAANTTLSIGTHIISASVKDSGGLAATDSITFSVTAAVNTAPSVSITSPTNDSTAEEGTALQLKATANDLEDGDLSSSISWHSSLDGSIGNLVTLSVGNHLITATATDSDGVSSSDEIFISITAAQATTHSVNISWSAPVERVDGTPLTLQELAGYQIHWKNQTTGSSGSINVSGAINTLYQIDDLQSGLYSFTLKSVDSKGLVSSASSELLVDL